MPHRPSTCHTVWGRCIAASLMLACMTACSDPIQGEPDSLVNRLTVGMTPAEVGLIMGTHSFAQTSPRNPAVECRSYVYDVMQDAKFAHVWFRDGKLRKASDHHRTTCNPR